MEECTAWPQILLGAQLSIAAEAMTDDEVELKPFCGCKARDHMR
jgi:hypothetical protein